MWPHADTYKGGIAHRRGSRRRNSCPSAGKWEQTSLNRDPLDIPIRPHHVTDLFKTVYQHTPPPPRQHTEAVGNISLDPVRTKRRRKSQPRYGVASIDPQPALSRLVEPDTESRLKWLRDEDTCTRARNTHVTATGVTRRPETRTDHDTSARKPPLDRCHITTQRVPLAHRRQPGPQLTHTSTCLAADYWKPQDVAGAVTPRSLPADLRPPCDDTRA